MVEPSHHHRDSKKGKILKNNICAALRNNTMYKVGMSNVITDGARGLLDF